MNDIEKKIIDYIKEFIDTYDNSPIKTIEISKKINIPINILRRHIRIMVYRGEITTINNGKNGISFILPKSNPTDIEIKRNLLKNVVSEMPLKDVTDTYRKFIKKYRLFHFPKIF